MIPGAERIANLDKAWAETHRGAQLRAVRRAAEQLRERLAGGPRCIAVRTLPLTTLAYPTRYAFWAAAFTPAPFVMMTHRCVLVQFFQKGELKNLLFNPTDIDGARATPFFARMIEQLGQRLSDLVAKRFEPLEGQLARHGIAPEDIDYVAFDHFHTQDLAGCSARPTARGRPRFPNAKLLAPKNEWEDWDDLHPFQRAWFVRDGKLGVRTENILLTEGDVALGDGVMLLRTPGHTSGNQTLFLATESGVWGISENGTCADNWSPLESRIRGLAFHVQEAGPRHRPQREHAGARRGAVHVDAPRAHDRQSRAPRAGLRPDVPLERGDAEPSRARSVPDHPPSRDHARRDRPSRGPHRKVAGHHRAGHRVSARETMPASTTTKDENAAKPSADDVRASWGFPRFAKDFPRHPELDALVAAFTRGDYAAVREGAPKLAAESDDEDVKRAARTLRERIEPDPTSKTIFLITAALLVFLTAWWVTHDGPEGSAPPPAKVVPKVEHVD